jgi:hypothetical protein
VVAAQQTLIDIDLLVGGRTPVGGPANNVFDASGDQTIAGGLPDIPGALLVSTIGQIRGGIAKSVTRVGPVDETTFDANAHFLRDIGPASFDGATRTVSWSVGSEGQPPDGVQATLAMDLPGVMPPSGNLDVAWYVVAPFGTSLRLPALPSELAAFDTVGGTPIGKIAVKGHAVPGGVAALRARIFDQYGRKVTGPGTTAMVDNRGFL